MFRVIIADDEPKVLLLIKNLIQWDELGLELVATASDGLSALDLINAERPDVVITDIRMPGYDGIELIDRAKQTNPETDFIIVSGYRHFEYAQKAIRFGVEDYLLKPLKAVEINQTLRKMVKKYAEREATKQRDAVYSERARDDAKRHREDFVARLLADDDAAPFPHEAGAAGSTLERINREFDLGFVPDLFQGLVVKADVHYASINANVRRLLAEKTQAALAGALAGKAHAHALHATPRGIYGVVNFGDAHLKPLRRALLAVIDKLQAQGELFDRIKVTVGLGRATRDLLTLRDSLHDAETAVADRLLLGAGRIIEKLPDPDVGDVVTRVLNPGLRQRLLACVEIVDAGETCRVIGEVGDRVANDGAMSGRGVLAVADECLQILRFALKSQNAVDEPIEAMLADTEDKLGFCASRAEVFELLGERAGALVEHVAARRRRESNRPVREVQRYIQANYAAPVSLESVSQRAGFNPTYFSVLFKKETGLNFLEYLTDVRIREAKRLLADPAKTIADIAADVGYGDVKHFSRVFTRLTGIHPSKYRKLYY